MKYFTMTAVLLLACTGVLPANTVSLNGVGQADFSFGNGVFTVTLSNLTPAFDANTLLTDLVFTLSTPGPLVYNGVTQGQLVEVDNQGTATDVAGTPNWGFGTYSSPGSIYDGEYLLCTVCGAGVVAPNQPKQSILGPGDGGAFTSYSGTNGSISGNPGHNPLLLGSATFSFSGSSITPQTFASDVFFSFGTRFGQEVYAGGGGGDQAPEPMSFVLTGSALVGLSIFIRHRRSLEQK